MRRSDEAVRPFALPHSSPTQHSALSNQHSAIICFRTPQSEIGTPQHAFITPHSAFRTPQAAPTIHIPHSVIPSASLNREPVGGFLPQQVAGQ